METPRSINRRMTRSQSKMHSIPKPSPAAVSASAKKNNRRALADLTNDSPIFGLAPGISKLEITPISPSKNCATPEPSRGEDVLRCQVKSLLSQIDGATNRDTLPPRCQFNTFEPSPTALRMGPTPANTPADLLAIPPQPISIVEEKVKIRSLHFDSPGTSGNSRDDDEGSNWSVTVNVSSPCRATDEEAASAQHIPDLWARRDSLDKADDKDGDESEDFEDDVDEEDNDDDVEYDGSAYDDEEYYDEDAEEKHEEYDELCDGVSGMSVAYDKKKIPEFAGKHIRFKYNSDDEIESEEVVNKSKPEKKVSKHIRFKYNSDDEMEAEEVVKRATEVEAEAEMVKPALSPSVLKLNGLPTPAGKHIRFDDL